MQVQCRHCNRPYTLKKEEVHGALDLLFADDLKHYNSQCAHCGKNNRVSKKQLRQGAPTWKKSE